MSVKENLIAALRTAMDFAGTMPAKASVKVRPQDWHNLIDQSKEVASILHQQEERIAELTGLVNRLRLEAQGHASEARTAKSTIYEIYQALSGSKGETGNWHGAEPARQYVASSQARVKVLEEAHREVFISWIRQWVKKRFGKWITYNTAIGAFNDFDQARTALQQTKEGK